MVNTTFCTSGMVLAKAGDGVNSTLSGGGVLIGSDYAVDVWITEAESLINTRARYNFTDNYSSLNDDVKKILQGVASDLAAINAIAYDMSGYSSRTEAEDKINILRDSALRGLSLLGDKKFQDFINNA